MNILNKLVLWKKKQKFNVLLKFKNNPAKIQKKILLNILEKNRNTEFGTKHLFSQIRSYSDFQRQVPIRTATDYQTYFDAMYRGEHQCLCQQPPFFFAMTAGSTGKFKHIPINKCLNKEIDNGVLSYLYLFEQRCPDAQNMPIQFLVGSAEGGYTPGGIAKGFVSGFHYKNLPKVIRKRFVIPYWVFTIEDISERYYAMVRFLAAEQKLIALISMTPQNLCMVARAAIEHKERLSHDIASGNLTLRDTGIFTGALPHFTQNTQQADQFRQALDQSDHQGALSTLFPSLTYFSTWMGGNMSYALNELFELYGKKDIFELPSSASEGLFLIPNELNTPGGLAAISSHFFEYIPEEQYGVPNPDTLLVDELEIGKRYYLVITTSGGLYRYNIEDLYEVTGKWGKTPKLRFISKQARQISITNERINESDVVEAMNHLSQHFTEPPKHFILMPNKASYYDLVLDKKPQELAVFCRLFDQSLGNCSPAYQYYRKQGQIKPLKVHCLENDALAHYVKDIQFRSNLPTGQFKPIHIANSVELFEEHFSTAKHTSGQAPDTEAQ